MDETLTGAPNARRTLPQRLGAFLFAWRNWIFTAGLLGLLVGLPPVTFQHDPRLDLGLDLLGFVTVLAGQGLRMLVVGQTGIESGGKRKQVDARALDTGGPMAHVRNPLYLGNLLVVLGLSLIHNHPAAYLGLFPLTGLCYQAIVAAEEAFLLKRFGAAYADYCRRVPRWRPRLRGWKESLRDRPVDWRRVALQEYGSIYLAVGLPLLVMILEQLQSERGPNSLQALQVLGGCLLAATLAWAWARRVKLAAVARRKAALAATEPC